MYVPVNIYQLPLTTRILILAFASAGLIYLITKDKHATKAMLAVGAVAELLTAY